MEKKVFSLIAALVVGTMGVQAQTQTWDPDGNDASDGGAGTWDTTTGNWITASPWVNGNNAIFGDAGANYNVTVAAGGVTVGDLAYTGTHRLLFLAEADNNGMINIKSGGATWDTGGGEILLLANTSADSSLSIGSGDTLTVNGGGTFNTGEKPTGASWVAAGATLDITEATTLKGNAASVGAFSTVKLAGGSKFVHERNGDQSYANNWELGAGTVTFDNRWGRNYNLNGVVSGDGGLKAQNMANYELRLYGNNTFSGGLEVSTASRVVVQEASDLGSVDNDITLSGGGILKAEGVDFGNSRDIILSGAGGSIINAGVNTFGGKITGDGNLQIGNSVYSGNVNTMTLTGNSDYTGSTTIERGTLALGINDALSTNTVVTIGGGGSTSRLDMNGYDQTIAGLTIAGSNTRVIRNNSATDSTLTLNVAAGESYSYGANIEGSGTINIAKTGDGLQSIYRSAGFTTAIGDLAANGGTLVWDVASGEIGGAVSVGAAGTLQVGNGGTTGTIDDKNVANSGLVHVNRSDDTSYAGVISGTGGMKVTGGGTHTLNASQTYTGDTEIDLGRITAGVANALSSDTVLRVGGASGGSSLFEMNGLDQQVGGLQSVGSVQTRAIDNNGGSDATLTVNVGTGESYDWNSNFRGGNAVNFVKTGDGTQIMTKANYTTALGDVTVNGGELVWNSTVGGGSAMSGTMTVGLNGTLSGSGLIEGATSVAGSLNPGNSPGTMTFNDALTLESTATLTLEFISTTAGDFDVLANDGGDVLTAGGVLELVNLGYTAQNGDSFLVFDNWADFSGSFSSVTAPDLGGGLSFDTSNLLVDGTISVIPEPATLGLVALMGGSLFWVRRIFMV
ncbi:PEP-CTERM sorting domain-containing protein [Pontiellaceae bacterium B12227]|nr:PEP-CTERM sorting domain-containing protein [Pontiellaceae bacterium B12227]